MELNKIRKRIDTLDNSIKELLLERFDLSREVGKSKIEEGSKVVFRKDREREILAHLSEGLDLDSARLLQEIYKNIMVNSRNVQYKMLADNYDLDEIEISDESVDPDTLVCQGIAGAYSHLAAKKFGDKKICFEDSFKEVFQEVSGQKMGILPLDNSIQGMVSEVYDLLLLHGFYIVKNIDLNVRHVAMMKRGAKREDIKYVTAHPQALSQCSNYIEANSLKKINASNNAVAAKTVADGERYDICCLGDKSNSIRYGLDVLDEEVANSLDNTTRFIVVADRLIAPKTGGRVSIIFNTDNSSGTLANVLNIVASYGMSLSKIESRPIVDDKWEYLFYADIEGNIRDKDMKALLFCLKSELPFIKVLGSYDELK